MVGARRVMLWFLPAAIGVSAAGLFAFGAAEGLSGRLGQPVGDAPVPIPTPALAAAPGSLRIVNGS